MVMIGTMENMDHVPVKLWYMLIPNMAGVNMLRGSMKIPTLPLLLSLPGLKSRRVP